MPLSIPGREDLATEFLDDYSVRFPEKNTSRGSDGFRLSRVISGLGWLILAKLLGFDKQRLPDTATGSNLQRWGNIYTLKKNGPSESQGAQALKVFGTPTTIVPTNEELTHADGTIYEVASVNLPIGGGGFVIVDVASISTGSATNKRAGDVLTFSSPPLGITAQATLVADLQDGADNEEDEEYRPRLLDRIGTEPEGGAPADYVNWAGKVPGVARVFVWRHRRGLGTIDIAVLGAGTGTGRIIADLAPVTAAIDAKRPGDMKDYEVLTTTAQAQDITALIDIDTTNYKWDWDDAGVGYAISASNQGASTITVPTIPASVVVGSRLTVEGEEASVSAVAGDVLTLSFSSPDGIQDPPTWFSTTVAPTGDPTGLQVRASGDLVVPVRNRMLALFNTLGPARDARYAATSWDDTIRFAKILAAATDTTGVIDAELTTPGANVTPVDALGIPSSTQNILDVPLLVPGKVRVWKM